MMIVPRCSSWFRITPCQIRKPASVTTNDGTPTYATIDPCTPPIAAQTATAITIARMPFSWCPLPGSWSSATTSAPMPARYPIDRSISPSSRTKTTPKASIAVPAIWLIRFVKLTAVKKFVAVSPKRTTTRISPTMIGAEPRLPVLTLNQALWYRPREAARGLLPPRPASGRRGRRRRRSVMPRLRLPAPPAGCPRPSSARRR